MITREIERLNARVKDLEEQLKSRNTVSILPGSPSSSTSSPASLDPLEEHQGNQRQWEGTWTTGLPSHQMQLHGPSSSFYFLARLGSTIGLALQLPHADSQFQPSAANRFFASPTTPMQHNIGDLPTISDDFMVGENLSRAQEDYFLSLFWQSYHCTVPILDELEFRNHFESLWVTSSPATGMSRKPSPLVDIVLALCMQYGMAFIPRNGPNQTSRINVDSNDSSIAGRRYFRRCQMLLQSELETPSLFALQCCVFSAIYLRDASFLNLAHNSLAVAIRVAYVLGLHQESPYHFSRPEKELRKRLWWAVYTLESKACMALGRPWLSQVFQMRCTLPADDQELAHLAGPNFASTSLDEHTPWLSYYVHYVKLVLAARAVHIAFDKKCAQVLGATGGTSIYENAQSLETLASFLSQGLQCIRTWAENVPNSLKTERRGGGKAFSTDRSTLEVDIVAPQWLQRQRLLLELLYHNVVMNLYRPFICFASPSSSAIPLADGNSISCLNHAIATTSIILQLLTTSDTLNGWHEAYQFQWNATLSMIGFIFAYPVCPPTPSARKAVNDAITIFDIFRDNFAVAASATNVTRDLAAKVDMFIDRFRTSLTGSQPQLALPTGPASTDLDQTPTDVNMGMDFMSNSEMDTAAAFAPMSPNMFSASMEMGFSIDPFSGFEWPLPEGNGIVGTSWPQFANE